MARQCSIRFRIEPGQIVGRGGVTEEAVTADGHMADTKSNVVAVDKRTFTAMMEQLQEGYVTTVAATAGCTVEPIPKDLYGCDLRLVRPGRRSDEEEVPLLVQLKNTTTVKPNPAKAAFSFKLRKRAYLERLALKRKIEKAILIVMITSPIQAEWTVVDHDLMLVKHCCYWETLEGHPVDRNVNEPSVRIRTTNVFDAPALTEIMNRLGRGESLS